MNRRGLFKLLAGATAAAAMQCFTMPELQKIRWVIKSVTAYHPTFAPNGWTFTVRRKLYNS